MRVLEILHWNDIHGHWRELAQLAQRSRAIRESSDHPVLVFDGGDVEDAGVRLSALSKGLAGWRLLGAAGVDAAVAGNGGLLPYGPQMLPAYAQALTSPPLVCDLEADGGVPEGAAASRLLTAGDVRVGVIGATSYFPQYASFGLTERGRVTAICSEASDLRHRGADVVVLLSHCGLGADQSVSEALRGRVDLIVGGHSHDALVEGQRSKGLPIVQAGSFGEWLGRVTVEISDDGTVTVRNPRCEKVDDDWPADRAVLDELAACERDLDDWLNEPIAELAEPVSWHATHDSAAARLMAQALLAAHPGDVAIIVPAHFGAGLPAGRVTRGDVWACTSSPGNAVTASMTGAALRGMLQRGTSEEFAATVSRAFRGRPYGALHVVGTEVRGGELYVGGEVLDDSQVYRVTGSDVEFSTVAGLFRGESSGVTIHTPAILPEILEAFLTS